MSTIQVVPQSGIQLILMIGAGFMVLNMYPGLGQLMLFLGLTAWVFYNILNISRQF